MSQIVDSVACPGCARNYRWKPELAGRKATCKCGQTVLFPDTSPAAPSPVQVPLGEPPASEYDFNDPPPSKAAPVDEAPPEPAARCKGCQAPLPDNAVLCTACGLNQHTGKAIATKVKGPGVEAGDVARTAGRVLLSLVVGGVASLVGAGIWIAIVLITGFELGIIAWIIGVGIGFAMRLVNSNGSTLAASAAAAFALLAIALPKGLIALLAVAAGVGLGGLFSPFDLLWVGLAMASAFKLAKGAD